jgi:hypothetical protein
MSDPFQTGRRVLGASRRLLAPPPLAGLPAAYAKLLQDPGRLLEAAWGGPEQGSPAPHEAEARSPRKANAGRRPAESLASVPAVTPSGATPFSPLSATPRRTAARSLVTSEPPPSLPRVASPFSIGPTRRDDRPASFRPDAPPPRVLPLDLSRAAPPAPSVPSVPFAAAPANDAEPYGPERVYSEQARRVVEWPAARPVTAGDAALAAPGNALQEIEETLGTDPELQRLRSQLGEDDDKRARLQDALDEEAFGEHPRESQGNSSNSSYNPPRTPTSFSPLSSLMSKNVAPGNLVNVSAPPAQGPETVVPASKVISDDTPQLSRRGESDEGRAGRDESPRGAEAPSVDEVLDELYERLRLEFLRTYGTTGG